MYKVVHLTDEVLVPRSDKNWLNLSLDPRMLRGNQLQSMKAALTMAADGSNVTTLFSRLSTKLITGSNGQ